MLCSVWTEATLIFHHVNIAFYVDRKKNAQHLQAPSSIVCNIYMIWVYWNIYT